MRAADGGRLRAYAELAKPEITFIVVLTVAAGWWAARSGLAGNAWPLLLALAGAGLASGGTGALNMLVERAADARMDRTRRRPLPAGRVAPAAALVFGTSTLAAGLVLLAAASNPLAAFLAALTSLLYLFAYTPLKPRSGACVLVGSVPGALPPVIGWAAARGRLDVECAALFAIQFLWQVPHLTAVAWLHRRDYERVGWRLLPPGDPDGARTARRIAGYGIALVAASLLIPAHLTAPGPLYFTGTGALGLLFFLAAFRFALDRSTDSARLVFAASTIYLPGVLALFALAR
jgi:protoheme IX farnesyltransferase